MAMHGRTGRVYRSRSVRNERDIRWQFFYGGVLITAIVLVCVAVFYLSRLPALTISKIEVEGGETISHEDVRQSAEAALAETYFLLIPERFTYLYPHDALLKDIRALSKIADVSIEKKDRNTLLITIEEYVPHALWCGSVSDTQCVYLDRGGYAFAPADALSGGVFMRHITLDRVPESGRSFVSGMEMARIESFLLKLQSELQFRVHSIIHTETGDETYELVGGGKLLVSGTQSATTTFDNLVSILSAEAFKDIRPGNFNYIDLRFGNRIFVKKEADSSDTNASTTQEAVSLPTPE